MPIPSGAQLFRVLSLGLAAAFPVMLLVDWKPALIVGTVAIIVRELDRRAARAGFTFADGFLPFRTESGWPRGVQEDDDVRWDWTKGRNGHAVIG